MWGLISGMSWGAKIASFLTLLTLILSAAAIGYVKGVSKANEKIAKYEKSRSDLVADYEKKLSEKKVEIVTKYVDRVVTIKEKAKTYKEVAKHVDNTKINITNGWVRVHDAAAVQGEVTPEQAADITPSVKVADILPTITDNYAQYHMCAANLTALQNIVDAHNKTIDEQNAKARKR